MSDHLARTADRIRDKSVDGADGCRSWLGPKDRYGYGSVWSGGRKWRVHRLIFTVERGEIPEGLVIDHICHNNSGCAGGHSCPHRACVNPDHMEAVTVAVNSRRAPKAQQTECIHGHAYTPENTGRLTNGTRFCRVCARASWRRWRARQVAA